jgi:hypothetical protein
MRKPNYDFERAQRNNAKEEKAKAKAQKKREQKAADSQSSPQTHSADLEEDAKGGAEAPEG